MSNVIAFRAKEPALMMPGNWKTPGCPTERELCTTIRSCIEVYNRNIAALDHGGDEDSIRRNVRIIECLYVSLMDYLVE
jgi:hypothetical protein